MPIRLPSDLPAYETLRREGVAVMDEAAASRQDIRPLRIGLLNLMPKKIQTETQFARLIGAGPLQIELVLIRMSEHESRNTSAEHMDAFYRPFRDVRGEKLDGLVITGAPIEHLPFEEVSYWGEMEEVIDWTQSHVHMTVGVCWGAMAMAYRLHGVSKVALPKKSFGCFRQRNLAPVSPFLRGFSDEFVVPVSRWTEVAQEEVDGAGLRTLLGSRQSGPCLVEDPCHRALYVFNHFEYDSGTLRDEYLRDLEAGGPIEAPRGYFPDDDPEMPPRNRWRSHAHLLYGNWVNEIYQTTPYEIDAIGRA